MFIQRQDILSKNKAHSNSILVESEKKNTYKFILKLLLLLHFYKVTYSSR